MTCKTNLHKKYETEYEVRINSMNEDIKLLESLGLKKI